MRMLFCGHCHDVVRLCPERRYCKCGRSWGHYLPDNSTTVQTAYSLSLGISNPDFHAALQTLMQDRERFSPALSHRAWFNPDSEPDVTYVNEEVSEALDASAEARQTGAEDDVRPRQ